MSDDRVTRGIDDFAAWAGLSRRTVYRMIANGMLRSKMIGGRRMVIVASYLALIDTRPYHRSRNRSMSHP